MANIYPESRVPLTYDHLGSIKNRESGNCLVSPRKSSQDQPSHLFDTCHGYGADQAFAYTGSGEIMTDGNCLEVPIGTRQPRFGRCHSPSSGGGGLQKWVYSNSTKQFRHQITRLCLAEQNLTEEAVEESDGPKLGLKNCTAGKRNQQWEWQPLN